MHNYPTILIIASFILFSNGQSLLAACQEGELELDDRCVASNKVRYLQPNKPNLLQSVINQANPGDYIILKAGDYDLVESTTNKTALLIKDKKSLQLIGEDNVRIKTKQGWVAVLTVENSENIILKNIEWTHEVRPGACEGAVVNLLNVKDIQLVDSIFNGSGTFAVQLDRAHKVVLKGGKAINNSEGVFYVKNSQEITITDMLVANNDNSGANKNGILDIEHSNNIFFTYNEVKQNKNDYFKKVTDSLNFEIDSNEFSENSFRLYDASGTTTPVVSGTVNGNVLWSQPVKLQADLPEFTLEWIGSVKNKIATVKGLNVYKTAANLTTLKKLSNLKSNLSLLQIIPDLEVQTKIISDHSPIYQIEDVNFDGYQDLRIVISDSKTDSKRVNSIDKLEDNQRYRFWLFNPQVGLFIEQTELKSLIAPKIDRENRQIISSWKGSQVNYGTDYYQFLKDKLVLVRQELQDYISAGVYQLTVKERVGEELKQVAQKIVGRESLNTATKKIGANQWFKKIWQQLPELFAVNVDHEACTITLTAIPEHGLRGFYCHLQTVLDYAKLSQLAALPVFTQGPHTDLQLNLQALDGFGYYNPAFVQWLMDNSIPAATEPAFKELTQPYYNQYVRPLARTFYEVYKFWQDNPDYLAQEQQLYLTGTSLSSPTLPICCYSNKYEHIFQSMITAKNYDTQEVLTAATFWLRRTIDGTAQLWWKALSRLLETYDTDFIKTVEDEWLHNYQQFRQFISPLMTSYCQPNQVLLYSANRIITHYPTVTTALQEATPGSVVWLCPGVYAETIKLEARQHLLIYGDQASLITRTPGDSLITVKQSQYIEIAGLHLIQAAASTTIESGLNLNLRSSQHIHLRDNDIEGGYFGIGLSQVQYAEITGNQIHFTQQGIVLTDSTQVLLKYNRLFDNIQNNVTWTAPTSQVNPFQNDWLTENELSALPRSLNDLLNVTALEKMAGTGNLVAPLTLAFSWYQENNVEAAKWFQQAAAQGQAKAQYYLGWMYLQGEGVAPDYAQAAIWFEQAAKQGYAKAQNALGGLYYEGKGVLQDFAKARYWAHKAALQGDAKAQNNLAELYYQGRGGDQDLELAVQWVKKSAEQNYGPARRNLGQLYLRGEGVSRDVNEAMKWFNQGRMGDTK